jgi:HK97 family phage portal protein
MIAEALARVFTRGHMIGDDDELEILTGGQATAAGERVSPETALKVATVYACVAIIANGVRAMPLRVLRDVGDEVLEPYRASRLWKLLHDRPNPDMHAGQLWEWVTSCVLLRGNAYCMLEREPSGRVRWLRPLNPGRVQVNRDVRTGRKIFVVSAPDDREQVQFVGSTEDMLHVRGQGLDPLIGQSVIHYLRETIGRALSEDRHQATTMRAAARPGGILKVKGRLDDESATRLKEQWEAAHGRGRQGGTAVLEEDTTWEQVTMSASDMELVKQRAISREDIAVGFQIPGDLVLAGSSANLHYSSDVSRDVRLVKLAIMPWATRIQQALEACDMLPWGMTGSLPGVLVPRFNPDALLKADIKTRYEAYQLALDAGWMAPNEPRRIENYPPVEGFDKPKPQQAPPPREQRNGGDPLRDLGGSLA